MVLLYFVASIVLVSGGVLFIHEGFNKSRLEKYLFGVVQAFLGCAFGSLWLIKIMGF